jgi:hypothetical protein
MHVSSTAGSTEAQVRIIIHYLSLVILFTSLIDFFINRLVFRAGPEVLSRIMDVSAFYLALVGRISLTIEQLLLFVVLASAILLLLHERRILPRVLGILLMAFVACSALLYAPLSIDGAWSISVVLVVIAGIMIIGLAFLNVTRHIKLPMKQRLALILFLVCLVLSFIFPLYFRMYLLLGSSGLASLPLPLEAYVASIYSIIVTALAAFVYALLAPSPQFTLDYRNFAKAALLPTLLVVPIIYGMIRSFFVTQILGMVVAMSTDFALSHDLLKALVIVWWFFLTAILVLFLKGHRSTNEFLQQEAIGLVLIMSTTLLFNYPYYLMLGIAGVFLVCYPLETNTPGFSNAKRNSVR